MKILGVFYGRCDASNWREAERVAAELLEYMDFEAIGHLSPHDAIFPFDYVATRFGKKYLIDVTLRFRKPVKKKRLQTWRALGFEPCILILLPEKEMAVLLRTGLSEKWITLTPSMVKKFQQELDEFLHGTDQTKLPGTKDKGPAIMLDERLVPIIQAICREIATRRKVDNLCCSP